MNQTLGVDKDLNRLFTEMNITELLVIKEFLAYLNDDEGLFKEIFKLFDQVGVDTLVEAAKNKTFDKLDLKVEDFQKLDKFSMFYHEFINKKCVEYNKMHPENPINIFGEDLTKYEA